MSFGVNASAQEKITAAAPRSNIRSIVYTATCELKRQPHPPRHQVRPRQIRQPPKQRHRRKSNELRPQQRRRRNLLRRRDKHRPPHRPQPVRRIDQRNPRKQYAPRSHGAAAARTSPSRTAPCREIDTAITTSATTADQPENSIYFFFIILSSSRATGGRLILACAVRPAICLRRLNSRITRAT